MLSGELVFTVDGVEHTLETGDCIHYRSTVPHLIRNDGARPAEVLWVLTATAVLKEGQCKGGMSK